MGNELEGLVAVVTGSGDGIGRGIALKLSQKGAAVVVNDIVQSGMETTVKEINERGGKATGLLADISQKSQVQSLFTQAFERYGRVDILVNNAGICDDALIEDMTEEQWDAVIDVNLKGAFLCSQAALAYMRRNKYGRIINISAEDIFCGEVGMVNYHCSKYGMFGLTVSMANEMARFVKQEGADMTCNLITPGYASTKMRTEGAMSTQRQAAKKFIPLGRECDPEEDTGNTVAFFASKHAGYITGNKLVTGGGLYMSLIY